MTKCRHSVRKSVYRKRFLSIKCHKQSFNLEIVKISSDCCTRQKFVELSWVIFLTEKNPSTLKTYNFFSGQKVSCQFFFHTHTSFLNNILKFQMTLLRGFEMEIILRDMYKMSFSRIFSTSCIWILEKFRWQIQHEISLCWKFHQNCMIGKKSIKLWNIWSFCEIFQM